MNIRKHWAVIRVQGLVFAGLLLVALLGFEAWVRLTDVHTRLLNGADFPDGYFKADARLGADLASDFPAEKFYFRGGSFDIYTNSVGCFDSTDIPAQGKYGIAIGDSQTWGYTGEETNWTAVLERKLGIPIINCGVPGTGAFFQQEKLKRVIGDATNPPALVIQYYIPNDLNDDAVYPGYTIVQNQRVSKLKWLNLDTGQIRFRAEMSRCGNHLMSQYQFLLYECKPEGWLLGLFERHMNALSKTKRYVESLGAKYVLFEHVGCTGAYRDWEQQWIRIGEELHLVRETVCEGVQKARGSGARRYKHRYDPHWNKDGNQLIADLVLNLIKD